MLKNIDLKKDRKPDPLQSLIKKPLDPPLNKLAVAPPSDFPSKLQKATDQPKIEKKPEDRKKDEKTENDKKTHDFSKNNNEGWEEEDLQISLNEIENLDKENKEKRAEKSKEEPEEKKSKLFSKLFEVKSYVATKSKEEKPVNIQNSSKTTYFSYFF